MPLSQRDKMSDKSHPSVQIPASQGRAGFHAPGYSAKCLPKRRLQYSYSGLIMSSLVSSHKLLNSPRTPRPILFASAICQRRWRLESISSK